MSKPKSKLKDDLLILILRPVFYGILKTLSWTMKVEFVNWDRALAALNGDRPVIIGLWHGNLLSILFARLATQVPFFLTMVSLSKDGELATRLLRPLGADFVRGSSSKGGAAALIEAERRIKEEGRGPRRIWTLHLLDGPRGPRRKPKPGIVRMARATGAIVIPVEIGLSSRVAVRSWDRHRIPLPFCRMTVVVGEPIDWTAGPEKIDRPEGASPATSETSDKEEIARRLEELESAMEALARSEPLAARDVDLP